MKLKTVKTVTEEHNINTNLTPDLPSSLVNQLSKDSQKKFNTLRKSNNVVSISDTPKTPRARVVFILSGGPKNVDELMIAYYRVFGESLTRKTVYSLIYNLRKDGVVDRKEYRLAKRIGV